MIHLNQITKQQGQKVLYKNGSFQINTGEKIGLVGPNGAGKTTIFRIIIGEEGFDSGSISKPDKIVIGYFSQNIEEMAGRSVLNEVMQGNPKVIEIQKELQSIEKKLEDSALEPISDDEMASLLEKYGDLQTQFENFGGYDLESRAKEILSGLGFQTEDQNRPTETFSGGWKMRITLAKLLLQNPDVLLLDEPTNHLDVESIIWLENWLKSFKGAILMTSHDREFMNRLVHKVVEIAHQSITVYTGDYDFYEREKTIRLEQLIASARRQEEMMAKEEEFIARFAARASHAAQVQSRVKKLDKIDKIEIPPEERDIVFQWPEPPRGGDEVVKFSGLEKVWKLENSNKVVFKNINGLIKRQDRVALVGVNGAGKSTLLKVIVGHTNHSSGELSLGSSIQVGYFSQNSLDVLDPQFTIIEELQRQLPNATIGTLKSILGAFKFSGDDVEKKIKILSGGEKSRLVLASILAKAPNFLVLDEPTNHLDIKSRETLLTAVKNFPGTVLIVSHDRFFLKEMTTKVFELHKSELNVYEGSWDYYLGKSAFLNIS
jgi:ATP-binding cassette subfamily F protein 3